jgi:hypothetical protein
MVSEVSDLIARWFDAFQGVQSEALIRLVAFPFTFSRSDTVTVLSTEEEFVRWWTDYVTAIRADGVVTRGEILRLRVEPISHSAMIARMQSARLDQHGNMVKILTTAFVVYSKDGSWKVGASMADALMNTSEGEPLPRRATENSNCAGPQNP